MPFGKGIYYFQTYDGKGKRTVARGTGRTSKAPANNWYERQDFSAIDRLEAVFAILDAPIDLSGSEPMRGAAGINRDPVQTLVDLAEYTSIRNE